MATIVDWFLVADRSRAKIYQGPPDRNGHFSVEHVFEHPEGRLRRQEMESDEPGRISLVGKSRTVPETHEDPEHREARRFAGELCTYLESARREGQFDRLNIVAPPFFLGVLRGHLTPELRARIAGELSQEWTTLTDPQVYDRLSTLLATSH